MELVVNGRAFALDPPPPAADASVGDFLSLADEALERAGKVIVGLTLDGCEVDPGDFASLRSRPASAVASLGIIAESAADYRARAFDFLVELVDRVGAAIRAATGGGGLSLGDEAGEARAFVDNLGGLLAAEEQSLAENLRDSIDAAILDTAERGGAMDRELAAELLSRLEAMRNIFSERHAELRDPVAEMRRTEGLYAAAAEGLRELPVQMQTGREALAMQSVLLFVDIFHKVIRLMPELGRVGIDIASVRVGEEDLPGFHRAFNAVLRDLIKALEDKDTVLIGDLAEYEVAPRMGEFLAAVGRALPA